MAAQEAASSLPSQVRREVLAFRMVELQQVAERLGLRKTGRKGELQARILSYFGEMDPGTTAALGRSAVRGPMQQWKIEQSARVVHDVYCRMMNLPINTPSDQSAHSSLQLPGAGGGLAHVLPSQQQPPNPRDGPAAAEAIFSAFFQQQPFRQQHAQPSAAELMQQQGQLLEQLVAHSREGGGAAGRAMRVRCICHLHSARGHMLMCQGKGCGVWQHADCLGLGPSASPKVFLCELCRARLADPFWEVTEQILPPARLKPQVGRAPVFVGGREVQVQSGDRVFYLNQQQLEAVQRDPENHRVQVGCLLVGDEVLQRYHWPRNVDLKINSLPHRPYGRGLTFKLGINQRDDVASIGTMVARGRNSLTLSAADDGGWVVTLQLARRRSLDQVKALMLAPESCEQAVARVRRLVGGGDGDGSDDELLISHQVVSLKDPMSGQRLEVPARFADASGLQAFDLDSYLSMVARNRKWQDPTTLKNSTVEQLQVDTYTQRVLQCLKGCPSVADIEISAEGQWRPNGSGGDWFDVATDPAQVAAALAAGGGPAVKQDPEAAAGAGGGRSSGEAVGGAADGGQQELVVGDSSDEEEEDEAEELRKAAEAVRRASSAALDSLKRKAETEVIDLLSSDDEEPPPSRPPQQPQPQPPRQQQQQQTGGPAARQQQPGAGSGPRQGQQQMQQQQQAPLRIRLPVRPRASRPAGGVQAPPGGGPPLFQMGGQPRPMPSSIMHLPGLTMGPVPPSFQPGLMPTASGVPMRFPGAPGVPFPGFLPASQMLGAGGGMVPSMVPPMVPQQPSSPLMHPPQDGSASWQQQLLVPQQQAQSGLPPQQPPQPGQRPGQPQQLGQSDALDMYRADWNSDEALQALFEDDL